jgi:cytoskeletal protein CcmA (bactofilin family)
MWGSDKKNQRPNLAVDTLIGANTTIRGDVVFAGGLHIDGKVYGSLTAESGQGAVLVLSDKGLIEGELRAPHVVINGQVRGNIYAAERVELAAQAKITGNIYYRLLEMTAGAEVNGQIVRDEEPLKRLPAPQPAEPVRLAAPAAGDPADDDGSTGVVTPAESGDSGAEPAAGDSGHDAQGQAQAPASASRHGKGRRG